MKDRWKEVPLGRQRDGMSNTKDRWTAKLTNWMDRPRQKAGLLERQPDFQTAKQTYCQTDRQNSQIGNKAARQTDDLPDRQT